jgi:hypothetical protein
MPSLRKQAFVLRQRLGRLSCYPHMGFSHQCTLVYSSPAKAGARLPTLQDRACCQDPWGGTGSVTPGSSIHRLLSSDHCLFFHLRASFQRKSNRSAGQGSYAAASFNVTPNFWALARPVSIRHKSMASRRAMATIAFFLPERCLLYRTSFHLCTGG